jgi:2'-hydroxyisoflavone reductase
MSTHRRDFLRLSLAAGACLAAAPGALARQGGEQPASKKLRILVFGGTGFIGPKLVAHALERGHEVTLFNRGRSNTHLFPDLEKIIGDRDPDKGEGLKGLEGKSWDVVIDDNGYYPRHVKASADLLAKAGVGHYVYVSSISAYASLAEAGLDESAPLAKLEDPTVETMGEQFQHYGGLKVLCEQAAMAAFPERCTVIRPGYIVGPGDPTDRFTYWPVRISRGGHALIPGTPDDPIQVIDVRDLGEWMVRVAEARRTGVFNACGPAKELPWGEVIAACRKACASPAEVHWVGVEELSGEQVPPLPIWASPEGEEGGVHTVSNRAAVAAGLTFRPIQTTVSDTLEWFVSLPEERQARLQAVLPEAEEQRILKALGLI